MVRAAWASRREGRSRAVRETPDSASRGHRNRRAAMSGSVPVAEPAGGTTTRSSAGRAGHVIPRSRRCRTYPKAYTPRDVEGAIYERWLAADVFAPDGAGSTADPSLPPFTIIQPPPNVTGSLHLGHAQRTAVEDLMIRHARMRGQRALFLPGLDHASIAAQFVLDGILAREGESRQTLGRERYLERMARIRGHDARRDARPAAPGRGLGRLGPAALHDGRRLGQGRAGRLRTPLPGGPGLPDRGARQLVPGLPDQRQRPGGGPDAGDRHAVDGPLPPDRPGDGHARSRRDDQRRHDAPGDHPRRHGGRRPSGRPALRRRWSAARSASRSSSATCRSSPTMSSTGPSAPARSRSRPAHDHDDHATGLRHGLPRSRSLPTTRRWSAPGPRYDGLDRYAARATIVADLEARGDLVGSKPARDGHRPLPAQQRRHRAAAQDAMVHPDRAARRACPRPRPGADGPGSSPSDSRRPGSTG